MHVLRNKLQALKTAKKERIEKAPVINYRGKKYRFSTISLVLFPIGSIILAVLMNKFLGLRINLWLHEIIAKQVVAILNIFTDVETEAIYFLEEKYRWKISMPEDIATFMSKRCTGILAITIFVSIIIFTPHSQESENRQDIMWRKTVSIISMITLIYLFNVIRIAIQNYLYFHGFSWAIIHDSLGAFLITFVVHFIIFLFCNRHLAEIPVSIYYSGKLLYNMRAELNPQKGYQRRFQRENKIYYD